MRHLAIVIALASCERRPERLFSEAEITARTEQVRARIEQNRTRVCERPVLRGAQAPGRAAPDAQFVVEPNGDALACFEQLEALAATGSFAQLTAQPTAEVAALAERCGPDLERAVQRAIAHTDACSPYQVGVRAPDSLMATLHVAQLLGLTATQRATTDPTAALWLLAETARWSADMARGHASLVRHALYAAALENLADRAVAIVDTHALSARARDEIATAIDLLLATTPPFIDALRGERDYVDLVEGLAPLAGDAFTPPGGWGWMRDRDAAGVDKPAVADRDLHAAFLFASERALTAVEPGCTSSLLACGAAIVVVPTKQLGAPGSRDAVTGTLANELRMKAFFPSVERAGKALAHLATVRIHLALEAQSPGNATCPSPADLSAEVRTPPMIGDSFRFAVEADQITITPPVWLGSEPLAPWPCPPR